MQKVTVPIRVRALGLVEGIDLPEKWLSLVAALFCIELVFFKFLPDLGTAVVQNGTSALTDWNNYYNYYMRPGSVHAARFLGNHLLYWLAEAIRPVFHSGDIRLHPLRVSAGILTPLYLYSGLILAIQSPQRYAWRYFMAVFTLAALVGLYAFYPCDMPAYATLSIALFFLLEERMVLALLFTVLTGLFRESSFHAVVFVFIWALTSPQGGVTRRMIWVALFGAAFIAVYVAVRHFFPAPVSSAGGVMLNWRTLFLDKALLSLTTTCVLGLELVIVIGCLVMLRQVPLSERDWRYRFFQINCLIFPIWIPFYRMLAGNISEFRMLLPAFLPCIYGIAYCARQRAANYSGPRREAARQGAAAST